MSAIDIYNLAGDKPCTVMRTLRPGFLIIDYDGEFVFAELQTVSDPIRGTLQRWELWAGSPSESEKAALDEVIRENGGFDETTVVVVPPTASVPPPRCA